MLARLAILLDEAYHVAHLVCNVLEPCLLSFTLGNHVGESGIRYCILTYKRVDSLLPDDGLSE